ncbi:ankyrin repeat domain-containing protein [Lysinibacillus sp. NPDC059133]|uniref:ankyrin repeat domain-containing protein n=1 Tax=Lysinibacillus sp. NPDC059133 TaxID=3346737 RepID=UPI0036A76B5A
MGDFLDLYDLVEIDEFEEVKDILNENPSLVLGNDEYGFTLLHAAASAENPELVKYLIDLGVNVNSRNDEESIDIIQLLLKRGANLEIKNAFGKIALDIAKSREETLIIKELLKNS